MNKEIKLKIDGKDYVFTFGLGYLGELLEFTGFPLDELYSKILKNPYKWLPIAMFESAKFSKELEGEEIDFTANSILEGLSKENGAINCDQSFKFMRAFNESMIKNVPVDEEVKDKSKDVKKKIDWGKDVISLAIGELGCPSLDYVYRMTWAEFRIRLFSYKRQQLNDLYKVREVTYQIYVSNWQSKKKPLSKSRFWNLEGNKNKMTELMRKRIIDVKAIYNKERNG